ncbi:alpha/beta fold hydrolase [Streptomyces sp. NPDC058049]|uniref:alpha/beta fold hydrolase n=1 Tax=Streptomyces sp. NPDC058049 TaxID=3346314 RepID=UPI0036E2CA36
MADDLEDLLDHFGPGPFVLVGHRAGSPLVRLVEHVTAARSGHYVPFTEPGLITEEIRPLAAPPAPAS